MHFSNRSTSWLLAGLTMCCAALDANAAGLAPKPPQPPPQVPLPGQRCTVEAANVGGIVNSDGSMYVANVPAGQAAVRLRAVCTDPAGVTVNGQSASTLAVPSGTTYVNTVDFGSASPIAARLTMSPQSISLTGIGNTQSISVGAVFPDSTSGDVTMASSGTTYRSSNEAVAVVGPDGQVTAVGSGTAIITARNEGAIGLASVTVRPAALTALDVTPSNITISVNPTIPNSPVPLRSIGQLANGSSVDLTLSTAGTTYTSSNPAVAAVSADGFVLGLAGGNTTITAINGGVQAQIPVTVNAFNPTPIAAYNTPGYAYDVDVKGNNIYVADGASGLQIYSATSPTVLGKLAFPGYVALDVRVRDTIAAVAINNGGVAIVDVSSSAQPKELWRISGIGSVGDVWISGNRVYAASSAGMRVYDISNLAAAPVLVGAVTGFNATAVAADTARGIAVVGVSPASLRVVRMTGATPWPQATVALPAYPYDVALLGTTAYAATGTAKLQRIDVTRPEAPVVTNTAGIATINALGVAVQRANEGTLVAAADNIFVNAVPLFNEQLTHTATVDFANHPQWPTVTVRRDANGNAIALGDGYGVLAVGSDGIQIFRTRQIIDNGGSPPAVSITGPQVSQGLISGQLSPITATAVDDVGVSFVEFFAGNVSIGVDTTAPYEAMFSPGTPCTTQTLRARATDDYGNFGESIDVSVRVLCMDGQACASDGDCANNVCTGGVCQAPCNLVYPSCADLKDACPTAASGTYTIDPDGAGGAASFATYCDMTRGGGGWTLIAKMTNQDAKNWVNAKASWTGTSAYGNAQNLAAGADAKSPAWGTLPADEMMLTDNPDPASNELVMTTSGCLGGLTPSQFFTAALANYPTASGQTWYKTCQVVNTYVPGWTYEPNWLDANPESPNVSLTQGYLVIGRSDESDNYAVVSFYTTDELLFGPTYDPIIDSTGEWEGDVGLAASERNNAAFTTLSEAQDIGGPESCSLNDPICRTDYPQTVFVFAR